MLCRAFAYFTAFLFNAISAFLAVDDVVKSKLRSGSIYLKLKDKHKKLGDFYEMVFLLRQDVSHQDALSFFQKIANTIDKMSGFLHKVEYWGLRALRYRVKKNKQAHYYNLQYSGSEDINSALKHIFKVSDEAIRHIIIRIRELDVNPTIMVSRSSEAVEKGRVLHDEKYEPKFERRAINESLQDGEGATDDNK